MTPRYVLRINEEKIAPNDISNDDILKLPTSIDHRKAYVELIECFLDALSFYFLQLLLLLFCFVCLSDSFNEFLSVIL